jgi:hypothetical protein
MTKMLTPQQMFVRTEYILLRSTYFYGVNTLIRGDQKSEKRFRNLFMLGREKDVKVYKLFPT